MADDSDNRGGTSGKQRAGGHSRFGFKSTRPSEDDLLLSDPLVLRSLNHEVNAGTRLAVLKEYYRKRLRQYARMVAADRLAHIEVARAEYRRLHDSAMKSPSPASSSLKKARFSWRMASSKALASSPE